MVQWSPWFIRHHAVKTYGGSEGVAPLFCQPQLWVVVSGHHQASSALPPLVPIVRLDGPQSGWILWERENRLLLWEIRRRFHGCLACILVAITKRNLFKVSKVNCIHSRVRNIYTNMFTSLKIKTIFF